MTNVIAAMSMSLDGFVAGPNVSVAHPMGEQGERLHDWLFNRNPKRSGSSPHDPMSDVDRKVMQEVTATTGAVILGKRTFEIGIGIWGDTPYPVPCFVLTHTPQEKVVQKSGTFTFVGDGLESALRQAKDAAGDKNVILMGAAVTQQFLNAGLVDEIEINLVPVLLQCGLRLFEHLGTERFELDQLRVLESAEVTHLRYRIVK